MFSFCTVADPSAFLPTPPLYYYNPHTHTCGPSRIFALATLSHTLHYSPHLPPHLPLSHCLHLVWFLPSAVPSSPICCHLDIVPPQLSPFHWGAFICSIQVQFLLATIIPSSTTILFAATVPYVRVRCRSGSSLLHLRWATGFHRIHYGILQLPFRDAYALPRWLPDLSLWFAFVHLYVPYRLTVTALRFTATAHGSLPLLRCLHCRTDTRPPFRAFLGCCYTRTPPRSVTFFCRRTHFCLCGYVLPLQLLPVYTYDHAVHFIPTAYFTSWFAFFVYDDFVCGSATHAVHLPFVLRFYGLRFIYHTPHGYRLL